MAGVLLIDTCYHSVFWFHVLSFIHETNLSETHIKFIFLLAILEYKPQAHFHILNGELSQRY